MQEASEEAEEYEEVAERYQQERAETEQALEQQQEQRLLWGFNSFFHFCYNYTFISADFVILW